MLDEIDNRAYDEMVGLLMQTPDPIKNGVKVLMQNRNAYKKAYEQTAALVKAMCEKLEAIGIGK